MPAPATITSGNMTDLAITNHKVLLSDLGMEVTEALSYEEWLEVGARIGRVLRATGFMLGDWLVYERGNSDNAPSGRTFRRAT